MLNIVKNLIILADYVFWEIFDLSKFKKIQLDKIKKVLIIHSGAIGELLATTPISKGLKDTLGCEIHYMLSAGKADALKGNPNITKFYEIKSFKENLAIMKQEKYDLAVILWPGSLKMSYAAMLAGVKYRIGCFKMIREGPAFFYTRRWFPLKGNNQHSIQSNLDMIRLIGVDNKNPKMEFYFDKKDSENVSKFLKSEKVGKYYIIHPGFGGKNKFKAYSRYWPSEIYADIADHLLLDKKAKVIITGISEENETAEEIISKSKNKERIVNACGKLNLHELGALVKKADLVIAPDTSIVHIASVFDTKVVDLIGDGNPVLWHPWMSKDKYETIRHPFFDKKKVEMNDYVIKAKEIKKAINTVLG